MNTLCQIRLCQAGNETWGNGLYGEMVGESTSTLDPQSYTQTLDRNTQPYILIPKPRAMRGTVRLTMQDSPRLFRLPRRPHPPGWHVPCRLSAVEERSGAAASRFCGRRRLPGERAPGDCPPRGVCASDSARARGVDAAARWAPVRPANEFKTRVLFCDGV